MKRSSFYTLFLALLAALVLCPSLARSSAVRTAPAPRHGDPRRPGIMLPRGGFPATDDLSSAELDAFITQFMETHHIPGFTAAIVKHRQVAWTGAYGYAEISAPVPAEPDHLFILCSITKTVTGTALMTLYDAGLFHLDDPVNGYLPFTVENPRFPNVPITFRMLLTHASSIRDNWSVMPYYPGDSPIPLGKYLEAYFTPGGAYYDPDANFYEWKPGTQDGYSNIGMALAGFLVEAITGIPLDDYARAMIFDPLRMNECSYFLGNLDPRHVAMPYAWNGTGYTPYGQYGYSDYPSGQIRTSAPQLAAFLAAFMGGRFEAGVPGQVHVVTPATARLMLTPQNPSVNPDQGLAWYRWFFNGRELWGHAGGDLGATTEMWYDPEEEIGVVGFTNGEAYFFPVLEALFAYAERL